MHYVGVESAQHADHTRARHAQRQRRDFREHPRWHPVHPDAVVNLVGRRLAAWSVRGDDEGLMTGAAEMLDHPKHRVGDAVDIREEGFCDDRNAHARSVPSAAVAKVATGHTTRKNLVPMIGRSPDSVSSIVRTKKDG